ncbi:MAG: internalization-related competence protein ComEC/Rec2 [Deltaproteobacteria bacterium]|nr:internalization-related competence protein ComEC/Rec2 [Deltaproteobacteria bacterium]
MRHLLGPLPLAIALAVGISIAPTLGRVGCPQPLRWAVALAALVTARRRREVLVLAVVALGTARGARPPSPAPDATTVDDRVLDRVAGEIQGPVVRTPAGTGALLEAADAAIWVWSDEVLVPGERVEVTGYLVTPRGPRGPALPDRMDAALARGARFELTARHVDRLADTPGLVARAWRWAASAQATWAHAIDAAGGDPLGRAALRGIAVGDRSAVPDEVDARWRAVGIYHVLSVSGLHLAVVAGLVYALLRRLVAASWWGGRVRPARWAAPPALVIAIGYTLVTGAQLATLRALIVVVLVLVAAMLDRPVRLVDAIGFAAIVLLAWRPADLFDPAFQLSFTAALTLALQPRDPLARRGLRSWIRRGLVTSIWITITTAPITAFHFQQVAAGGVIGNLLLTPVVELVALPLALAGLAIGWDVPVQLSSWLVAQVDRGAALLAHVTPVGHVAIASGATLALLVALSIVLASRARRTRLDVVCWVALCLGWTLGRSPPPDGALRVTFVDVGQGDAALLELPDGAVWLVDAGGLAGAQDLASASAPGRSIARLLAAYGHDHIDVAIISHPHPDHYLGLAAIDVPIGELWTAPEPEPVGSPGQDRAGSRAATTPSFDEITAMLVARGTRVVHPPLGLVRAEAGVELVTWAPRYQSEAHAPLRLAADPVRTINDNSIVVAVRYRERTLLFSGDVEAEGEEALVAAGLRHVDVVKVAHHGSPTSSTSTFVNTTHPEIAVISCGRANQFRFPSPAVVARWRAAGAEVARTDLEGTITLIVDRNGQLAIDRFVPAAP